MKKKIFSGVQPTGNLHLGNYLGAIKNFVELNNDKEFVIQAVKTHSRVYDKLNEKFKNT